MSAAVIAGSFADYRLVKSRSVLQVIVEIPIEHQGAAFAALGYPLPGTEIAVAVARLNSPAGKSQSRPNLPTDERTTVAPTDGKPEPQHKPAGEHQRQRYAAMSPAEQAVTRAALLARDIRFQAWANECSNEDEAAQFIRKRCCDGNTRSLIAEVPEYLDRFITMETSFKIDVGEIARPR